MSDKKNLEQKISGSKWSNIAANVADYFTGYRFVLQFPHTLISGASLIFTAAEIAFIAKEPSKFLPAIIAAESARAFTRGSLYATGRLRSVLRSEYARSNDEEAR